MSQPLTKYYLRKCISCLNKVIIPISFPFTQTQAPCPYCSSTVRIWP